MNLKACFRPEGGFGGTEVEVDFRHGDYFGDKLGRSWGSCLHPLDNLGVLLGEGARLLELLLGGLGPLLLLVQVGVKRLHLGELILMHLSKVGNLLGELDEPRDG